MLPCLGETRRQLRAGPFMLAETLHAWGLDLPRHAHERACLHYVVTGRYHEAGEGGEAVHGAGALFYKPAGTTHWNRFAEGGACCLRIELDDQGLSVGLDEPLMSQDVSLRGLASRLHHELCVPDDLTPLAAEGLGLELLSGLARTKRRSERREPLAERARELIRERRFEAVSFTELAEELSANRSHLARSFRARFGCTMGEYQRRLRVDFVRDALGDTSLDLATISLRAGFADQSHCSRVFRRIMGVSPAAYRRG